MSCGTHDLTKLRGSELGRRVFVVGNGPSVLAEPLHLLRDQLSISMNAGILLSEQFGFESKYYALGDRRFLRNPFKRPMAATRLRPGTIRFVRADLKGEDERDSGHVTHYVTPLTRDGFSGDLRRGFHHGSTTVMFAMQIAAWLGVSQIVILGVDLKYPEDKPRFYREDVREEEDLLLSVQIKNLVDATAACERLGISVVSCSANSLLRSYVDYWPLSEIVQESSLSQSKFARLRRGISRITRRMPNLEFA